MLSENLQPKEVEYLKYLKTKGINAQESFSRLDNARTQGLFGEAPVAKKTTPDVPVQKDTGFMSDMGDAMKKSATPLKEVFTETLPQIGSAIKSGIYKAGADVSKIQRDETGVDTGIKPGILGRTVERFKGEEGVGEDIKAAKTAEVMGEQTPTTSLLQSMGFIGLGVSETIGDLFISGLKTIAPEKVETAVKEGLQGAINSKGGQAVAQEVNEALEGYEYLKQTDPVKARNYKAFFGGLSLAADATGLAGVSKIGVKETGKQVIKQVGKEAITPPIAPTMIKKGQGIVQGTLIKPFKAKVVAPVKQVLKGAEERIAKGPQEFIGKVGQKPVIKPVKPLPKATIVKGVDIAKSDDLIARGLKPTIAGKDTGAKISIHKNKIREGIESTAKRKGIPDDGIDALNKVGDSKKDVWKQVETNQGYVTKKTREADIADDIMKWQNSDEGKLTAKAYPKLKKKLDEYAEQFTTADKLSQDDLLFIKTKQNAKVPAKGWAELMTTDKEQLLADSIVARVLGNKFDNNIEEILGNTNKALMKEYGALRTVEKDLAKRMGVFTRNTQGGLTGLTDVFTLPEIIIGGMTGDIKQFGKGLLGKVISATAKRKENPNYIIKELFKLHGPKKPTIGTKIQKMTGLEDIEFKGVVPKITKPKPITTPKKKVTKPVEVKKPVETKNVIKKPKIIDSKKKVGDNKDILSKPKSMSNYKQSNLDDLIKQAKETGKMPLNEDIAKGFIEKPSLLKRKGEIDKIKAILKKEANIKDFIKTPKVIKKPIVKKDPNILDNLNPTGGLFVDYNPSKIAKMKLAKNITTLDKTAGKSPNDIVTIYRGTVKAQKDIVPGDFITTNYDLAKSYAGEGKVITKKVKYSTILDDLKEPLGEEYIYRPIK